jgi:hypothetical protein
MAAGVEHEAAFLRLSVGGVAPIVLAVNSGARGFHQIYRRVLAAAPYERSAAVDL